MANVLVTGANRGIGLEFCRQLLARGDDVIAACRRASPALRELGVELHEGIDVTAEAAVGALSAALVHRPLDLLINNAGVLCRDQLGQLDWEGLRAQFEVNALGPLRITQALLGNLGAGAKVAMVTSRMGSIADNSSGGSYGYRMSKAALNIASVSLARDLAGRGVSVAILHPGYVKTDMTDHTGNVEPPDSVRGMLARLDAMTPATSGRFWLFSGEELPW